MLTPVQTRNFLGNSGAATVVLLSARDETPLPKAQEIRRLFDCEDLRYYKGDGWYREEIGLLERASAIVKSHSDIPPWIPLETTDWLLLPPSTHQSLFFSLAHSSILVGGFDLTDACMIELRAHLDKHSGVQDWRSTVDHFYRSLELSAASAQRKQITDPTLTAPNIDGVKRLLHGYGDDALTAVTEDIRKWHATYKWKG